MTDNAAMTIATDALMRIAAALQTAVRYGGIEGDHPRAWVIEMIAAQTAIRKAMMRLASDPDGAAEKLAQAVARFAVLVERSTGSGT